MSKSVRFLIEKLVIRYVQTRNWRISCLCIRIKQLRTERGLLQKDIANTIGISLRAYQYYERGERTPDIETLEKLADYFQVSTDYLLGRTEKPTLD